MFLQPSCLNKIYHSVPAELFTLLELLFDRVAELSPSYLVLVPAALFALSVKCAA